MDLNMLNFAFLHPYVVKKELLLDQIIKMDNLMDLHVFKSLISRLHFYSLVCVYVRVFFQHNSKTETSNLAFYTFICGYHFHIFIIIK